MKCNTLTVTGKCVYCIGWAEARTLQNEPDESLCVVVFLHSSNLVYAQRKQEEGVIHKFAW